MKHVLGQRLHTLYLLSHRCQKNAIDFSDNTRQDLNEFENSNISEGLQPTPFEGDSQMSSSLSFCDVPFIEPQTGMGVRRPKNVSSVNIPTAPSSHVISRQCRFYHQRNRYVERKSFVQKPKDAFLIPNNRRPYADHSIINKNDGLREQHNNDQQQIWAFLGKKLPPVDSKSADHIRNVLGSSDSQKWLADSPPFKKKAFESQSKKYPNEGRNAHQNASMYSVINVVDPLDRKNSSFAWPVAAELLLKYVHLIGLNESSLHHSNHTDSHQTSSLHSNSNQHSQQHTSSLSNATLRNGLTSDHVAYLLNRIQFPAERIGFDLGLLALRIGTMLKHSEFTLHSQQSPHTSGQSAVPPPNTSPLVSFIKLLHPFAVSRILKLSVQKSQETLENRQASPQRNKTKNEDDFLNLLGTIRWNTINATLQPFQSPNRDYCKSSTNPDFAHSQLNSLDSTAKAVGAALVKLPPLWALENAHDGRIQNAAKLTTLVPLSLLFEQITPENPEGLATPSPSTSSKIVALRVSTPSWIEVMCLYLGYRQSQLITIEGLHNVLSAVKITTPSASKNSLHQNERLQPSAHASVSTDFSILPDSGAPIPLTTALSDVAAACQGRLEIPKTLNELYDKRLGRNIKLIENAVEAGQQNLKKEVSEAKTLSTDAAILAAESSMRASVLLHAIHSLQLQELKGGSSNSEGREYSIQDTHNRIGTPYTTLGRNVAVLPFASATVKIGVTLTMLSTMMPPTPSSPSSTAHHNNGHHSPSNTSANIRDGTSVAVHLHGREDANNENSSPLINGNTIPFAVLLEPTVPLHEVLVSLALHQLRHRDIPTPAIAGGVMGVLRYGGGARFGGEDKVNQDSIQHSPPALTKLITTAPALLGGHWGETMKVAEIIRRLHVHYAQGCSSSTEQQLRQSVTTRNNLLGIYRKGSQRDYGETFLIAIAACLEKVVAEIIAMRHEGMFPPPDNDIPYGGHVNSKERGPASARVAAKTRLTTAQAIFENIENWISQYIQMTSQPIVSQKAETSTKIDRINDALQNAEKKMVFSASLIEVVYLLNWCRSALGGSMQERPNENQNDNTSQKLSELYDTFLFGNLETVRGERALRVLSPPQQKGCIAMIRLLCFRPDSSLRYKTAIIASEVEAALNQLLTSSQHLGHSESNFFDKPEEVYLKEINNPHDLLENHHLVSNTSHAASAKNTISISPIQKAVAVFHKYVKECLINPPTHVLQKVLHPARLIALADECNAEDESGRPQPFNFTPQSPLISLESANGLDAILKGLTASSNLNTSTLENHDLMTKTSEDMRLFASRLLRAAAMQKVLRAALAVDWEHALVTDGKAVTPPPRLADAVHLCIRMLESMALRQIVNQHNNSNKSFRNSQPVSRYSPQGGHRHSKSASSESSDTLEMIIRHCTPQQLPKILGAVMGAIGKGSPFFRIATEGIDTDQFGNLLPAELCQMAFRRLDYLLPTTGRRGVLKGGTETGSPTQTKMKADQTFLTQREDIKSLKISIAQEIVDVCFGKWAGSLRTKTGATSNNSLSPACAPASLPPTIAAYLLNCGLQLPGAKEMLSLLISSLAHNSRNNNDDVRVAVATSGDSKSSLNDNHLRFQNNVSSSASNITDEWLVELALKDTLVSKSLQRQNKSAALPGSKEVIYNSMTPEELGTLVENKYATLLAPLHSLSISGITNEASIALGVVSDVHKNIGSLSMLLLSVASRFTESNATTFTADDASPTYYLSLATALVNATIEGHLRLSTELQKISLQVSLQETFSVVIAPLCLGCHNYSAVVETANDELQDRFGNKKYASVNASSIAFSSQVLSTPSVPAELLPLVRDDLLRKSLSNATTQITVIEEISEHRQNVYQNRRPTHHQNHQSARTTTRQVQIVFPSLITTTTLTGYYTRLRALVDHSWQVDQRKLFLQRQNLGIGISPNSNSKYSQSNSLINEDGNYVLKGNNQRLRSNIGMSEADARTEIKMRFKNIEDLIRDTHYRPHRPLLPSSKKRVKESKKALPEEGDSELDNIAKLLRDSVAARERRQISVNQDVTLLDDQNNNNNNGDGGQQPFTITIPSMKPSRATESLNELHQSLIDSVVDKVCLKHWFGGGDQRTTTTTNNAVQAQNDTVSGEGTLSATPTQQVYSTTMRITEAIFDMMDSSSSTRGDQPEAMALLSKTALPKSLSNVVLASALSPEKRHIRGRTEKNLSCPYINRPLHLFLKLLRSIQSVVPTIAGAMRHRVQGDRDLLIDTNEIEKRQLDVNISNESLSELGALVDELPDAWETALKIFEATKIVSESLLAKTSESTLSKNTLHPQYLNQYHSMCYEVGVKASSQIIFSYPVPEASDLAVKNNCQQETETDAAHTYIIAAEWLDNHPAMNILRDLRRHVTKGHVNPKICSFPSLNIILPSGGVPRMNAIDAQGLSTRLEGNWMANNESLMAFATRVSHNQRAQLQTPQGAANALTLTAHRALKEEQQNNTTTDHSISNGTIGLIRDLRSHLSVFDDAVQTEFIVSQSAASMFGRKADKKEITAGQPTNGKSSNPEHFEVATYVEKFPKVLPFWITDVGKRSKGDVSLWGLTRKRVVMPTDKKRVMMAFDSTEAPDKDENSHSLKSLNSQSKHHTTVALKNEWRALVSVVRRALGFAWALAIVDSFEDGISSEVELSLPNNLKATLKSPSPIDSSHFSHHTLMSPSSLSSVSKFCASSFPDELYASGLRLLQRKLHHYGRSHFRHYDILHMLQLASNAHSTLRSADLSTDARVNAMIDAVGGLTRGDAKGDGIGNKHMIEGDNFDKNRRFGDPVAVLAFRRAFSLPVPLSQEPSYQEIFNDDSTRALLFSLEKSQPFGKEFQLSETGSLFSAELLSVLFPRSTPSTSKLIGNLRRRLLGDLPSPPPLHIPLSEYDFYETVDHRQLTTPSQTTKSNDLTFTENPAWASAIAFDAKLSTIVNSSELEFDEGLFGRNAIFLAPATRVRILDVKDHQSKMDEEHSDHPIIRLLKGKHLYATERNHWKAMVAVLTPLLCKPLRAGEERNDSDRNLLNKSIRSSPPLTLLSTQTGESEFLHPHDDANSVVSVEELAARAKREKLDKDVHDTLHLLKQRFQPITKSAHGTRQGDIDSQSSPPLLLSSKIVTQFFVQFPHAWPIGIWLFSAQYPKWTRAGLGAIAASEPKALEALLEIPETK